MISSYVIELSKVLDYLLNPDHPDGGPKCVLFMQFGFVTHDLLIEALFQHIRETTSETRYTVAGRFLPKLVVEGPLRTPTGSQPNARSVWEIDEEAGELRLITAFIC